MKKLITCIGLLVWSGFAFAQINVPPSNDVCSSAQTLVHRSNCQFNIGSLVNATGSDSSCDTAARADDDVWFRFVATNGQVAIKAAPSEYLDPALEFFSGTCAAPQLLKCQNKGSVGENETLIYDGLIVGQTYYIREYHAGTGFGSGAFAICVFTPSFDFCESPDTLVMGSSYTMKTGNFVGNTFELGPPVCPIVEGLIFYSDVWYQFEATSRYGSLQIITPGATTLSAQIYSGSCGNLKVLDCIYALGSTNLSNILLSDLTIGQTYRVRISNMTNVPQWASDFQIGVKSVIPPTAQTCQTAIPINKFPFKDSTQITCNFQAFYKFNCGDQANNTIGFPGFKAAYYKLNVTKPNQYFLFKSINTQNFGTGPSKVVLYEGCPEPFGRVLNCERSFIGEKVIHCKQPGEYYLGVTSSTNCNFPAAFTLDSITDVSAFVPPYDSCAGAIDIPVFGLTDLLNPVYFNRYNMNPSPDEATPCPNELGDVWFKFVAKSRRHELRYPGVANNGINSQTLRSELYQGSCGNLILLCNCFSAQNLAGNNFNLDSLTPGETYLIRHFPMNQSGQRGVYLLDLESPKLVVPPPANDLCTLAETVVVSSSASSIQYSNIAKFESANYNGAACSQPGSKDVWYKFTPASASVVLRSMTTNWVSYKFKLGIYSGSCANPTSVFCDTTQGYLSQYVIHNLQPGQTYFLSWTTADTVIVADDTTYAIRQKFGISELDTSTFGLSCQKPYIIPSFPYSSGLRTIARRNFYIVPGTCSAVNHVYRFNISQANTKLVFNIKSYETAQFYIIKGDCNCQNVYKSFEGNVQEQIEFIEPGTYYLVTGLFAEQYKFDIEFPQPLFGNYLANDSCGGALVLPLDSNGITQNFKFSSYKKYPFIIPDDILFPFAFDGYQRVRNSDLWYKLSVQFEGAHILKVKDPTLFGFKVEIYKGSNCGTMKTYYPVYGYKKILPMYTYLPYLPIGDYYLRLIGDTIANRDVPVTIAFTPASIAPPSWTQCPPLDFTIPTIPFTRESNLCGKGNQVETEINNSGEDEQHKINIPAGRTGFKMKGKAANPAPAIYFQKTCTPQITGGNSFGYLNLSNDSTYYGYFKSNTALQNAYITVDLAPGQACGPYELGLFTIATPANDLNNTPTNIAIGGTGGFVAPNFFGATNTPTAAPNFPLADLFYKYVAPAGVSLVELKYYDGDVLNHIPIVYNGWGSAFQILNPFSTVTRGDTIVQKYSIPFNRSFLFRLFGKFNSEISSVVPSPGKIKFSLTPTFKFGYDECNGALAVNPAATIVYTEGDNRFCTPSPQIQNCAGFADDDSWMKFTVSQVRNRLWLNTSGNFSPFIQLYSGSCTSLSNIQCITLTNAGTSKKWVADLPSLTVGTNYFLRIYHGNGGWGDTGTFKLAIQTLPNPPAFDECGGATLLISSSNCNSTNFNTLNCTQSRIGCSGSLPKDAWFRFLATQSAHQISVTGSGGMDAVLEGFSGTCNALSSKGCTDLKGINQTENAILTDLVAGQTYFIRVYDFKGTMGNFSVCVIPYNDVKIQLVNANPVAFCQSDSVEIQWSTSGIINPGNVFRVQLSDSSGNFAFPVQIGITAKKRLKVLLSNLPGSQYWIRVISINPTDTSKAFKVFPKQIITPPILNFTSINICEGNFAPTIKSLSGILKWYSNSALTQFIVEADSIRPPTLVRGVRNYFVNKSDGFCNSAPVMATINYSEKPLPPIFSYPFGNSFCSGDSVKIVASGTGNIQWLNGFQGNSLWTKQAGNYVARFVSHLGCIGNIATAIANQKTAPNKPFITPSSNQVCSGDSIKISAPVGFSVYQWSNGQNINPIVVYNSGKISLRIKDTSGCFSPISDSVSMVFYPKPDATISLQSGSNVCEGDTVRLSVPLQGNVSYAWFRNNSNISAATTNKLLVTQSGNYQAKVNSTQCQSFSEQRFITFAVNPTVEILDVGGQLIVSSGAVSGALYIWWLNGSAIDTTQIPIFSPNISGLYQLRVMFPNGCFGLSSFLLITSSNAKISSTITHIYPNPGAGKVQVVSSDPVSLKIFSVTGKALLESKANIQHQLELRSFGAGLYIFEVWNKGKREVRKVLVQ